MALSLPGVPPTGPPYKGPHYRGGRGPHAERPLSTPEDWASAGWLLGWLRLAGFRSFWAGFRLDFGLIWLDFVFCVSFTRIWVGFALICLDFVSIRLDFWWLSA